MVQRIVLLLLSRMQLKFSEVTQHFISPTCFILIEPSCSINLSITECEGRTGEYWPEVVAVKTERSEVCAKKTEGQYSPVRLELVRLVSCLSYGTRAFNLPPFESKKYKAYMTVSTEIVRMAQSRPRPRGTN